MRHAGQETIRGCDENTLEYLLLVHTVHLASLEVRCSMLPKNDILRIETSLLFDCSSLVARVYSQVPGERKFLYFGANITPGFLLRATLVCSSSIEIWHVLNSHGMVPRRWRKGLAWLGVGQVHNDVCSRDRGLQSSVTWTKHGNREALVGSMFQR
jgi:hypothetical protein